MTSVRKKLTPVIEQPVMNNGLRKLAPMSEMYAIFPVMEGYLGRPSASHTISIASSMPVLKELIYLIRVKRRWGQIEWADEARTKPDECTEGWYPDICPVMTLMRQFHLLLQMTFLGIL